MYSLHSQLTIMKDASLHIISLIFQNTIKTIPQSPPLPPLFLCFCSHSLSVIQSSALASPAVEWIVQFSRDFTPASHTDPKLTEMMKNRLDYIKGRGTGSNATTIDTVRVIRHHKKHHLGRGKNRKKYSLQDSAFSTIKAWKYKTQETKGRETEGTFWRMVYNYRLRGYSIRQSISGLQRTFRSSDSSGHYSLTRKNENIILFFHLECDVV